MRKPTLVRPGDLIGWRRDGRPIHLIGGGAPDDNGNDDQQQQDGSLLEGDADDLTGDGDGDDGDTGDGGDTDGTDSKGGKDGHVDEDAIVAKVAKSLETQIASMFDRRVNAVLKELRKNQPKTADQNDGQGDDDGTTQRPQADLRGARFAFREYIGDEIRFISTEERRFGADLGQAMLRARAAEGFDDEDRTGREVAEEVARTVKSLRKHYEDRVKRALKKQGALVEKQGQAPAGGNGVSPGSEFQKGRDLALAKFGDRLPQKTTT